MCEGLIGTLAHAEWQDLSARWIETSMTTAEIAAYIGAAAWLPQIATWLYRRFVRPLITIVPDKYAEVGFTSYGPIFNVRMAFSSERKDVIIDGFEILLEHEDGDTRTVRWAGLTRITLGTVKSSAAIRRQLL